MSHLAGIWDLGGRVPVFKQPVEAQRPRRNGRGSVQRLARAGGVEFGETKKQADATISMLCHSAGNAATITLIEMSSHRVETRRRLLEVIGTAGPLRASSC